MMTVASAWVKARFLPTSEASVSVRAQIAGRCHQLVAWTSVA